MYSQPIEGRIFLWISEHASTHQSSGEQIYSVYATAKIFINTIGRTVYKTNKNNEKKARVHKILTKESDEKSWAFRLSKL